MNSTFRKEIEEYVSSHIDAYHDARAEGLKKINLSAFVRRKNPYLFRVKNMTNASDFVEGVLQAHLSSSEEGSFGNFLEGLAIFVCKNTLGGDKTHGNGLDLELNKKSIRYLIAIKSGAKWGNSSQRKKLKQDFEKAITVLRQNGSIGQIQAVEGICYGRAKDRHNGIILKLEGQSFWELISDDPCMYSEIIEPLGHRAEEHAKRFKEERDAISNRLIREFTIKFCNEAGEIDWKQIVTFVSRTRSEPTC